LVVDSELVLKKRTNNEESVNHRCISSVFVLFESCCAFN